MVSFCGQPPNRLGWRLLPFCRALFSEPFSVDYNVQSSCSGSSYGVFATLLRIQIGFSEASLIGFFRIQKAISKLFEYRSVRYWSKEINGTLTRGPKQLFFKSRRRLTIAP